MATAVKAAEQDGKVCRFKLPKMGPPYSWARRQMVAFGHAFEAVLLERHGSISPWQAKLIRTASKAYGHAWRVDSILRTAGAPGDKLTHEQYQAYLDRSLKYEQAADAALRALGLDQDVKADVWASVYSQPLNGNAPPPAALAPPASAEAAGQPEGHPDAPDAATGQAGTLPGVPAEGGESKTAVAAVLPDAEVPDAGAKVAVTATLPGAAEGAENCPKPVAE